jgi:hypothetical protein
VAGREHGLFVAARRFTTVLPAMPLPEVIDTACMPRVAGLTGDHIACMTVNPAAM